MEQTFIDQVMDFNPSNLSIFNEPENSNNYEQNVYKTNPVKFSKSEDGHYHSVIKICYNGQDIKKSIVPQATYAMNDFNGFFMVKSKLANGDRSCPLFTSWKKLWFSGDEQKKEWAKQMYDKTESQWVLVQILEDDNQPELVGQFKVMKLPKAIYNKMSAKMNPSPESKKAPVPIMDYIFGLPLVMDVTPGPDDPKQPSRKQREISYDLCEFDTDYAPIIKTDGTPLFDETELELIDTYASAKADVLKAKTAAKKAEKEKILKDNYDAIKQLYIKALNYVKENAVDLCEECEFKEWDEATTKRVMNWIELVAQMKDPKTTAPTQVFENAAQEVPTQSVQNLTDPSADVMSGNNSDEDLPF